MTSPIENDTVRFKRNVELADAEVAQYRAGLPKYDDPNSLPSLIDYYQRRVQSQKEIAQIYGKYDLLDTVRAGCLEESNRAAFIANDLANGDGQASYQYFKTRYEQERDAAKAKFEIHRGKQKFHEEQAKWWELCLNLTQEGKRQ